jgi:hypothetical protein
MYPRRAKRTAVSASISRYSATASGPTKRSGSGNSNRLQVEQSGLRNRSVPVAALLFWRRASEHPGFSANLVLRADDSRPSFREESALRPPEMCRFPGIQHDDTGTQN